MFGERFGIRLAIIAGLIGLASVTVAVAVQLFPATPATPTGLNAPAPMIPLHSVSDAGSPVPEIAMGAPSWVGTPRLLPVEGWFSDGFRWRNDPLTGAKRFHRGLDIVAPAGTIVRAPADGVVMHASPTGGYGNMIEIRHGDMYTTRFAHLEAFLTEAGRIVRLGQPIGLVGSTGRAKGAHLHYEIFKEGRRINPWPYLGDRKDDPGRPVFPCTHATVRANGQVYE